MVLTLDAKRRLTLPKKLMPAAPGDSFEVIFDEEEGTVICRQIPSKNDWLAVLKDCPLPMDDLPRRPREFFKPKL